MAQKKKAEKSLDEQKKNENKSSAKKSETSAQTDKKSSDKKPSEKKLDKKSEKKSEKKPSVFSKIAKYFRECRSEIKKIVWPTTKATFKNMGIVLVVLLILGLFIYALDTGLLALLKLVMDI